jgi:hypothetical protein
MIERIRTILRLRAPEDGADDARIRLEGYPGRGTVVAVRPTGRRRSQRREIDLTLDVYLGRSRTFRVVIRPWVLDAELARLQPGQAVPVAADHAEPGHVVLAFDMDEVRSIEGLGRVAGGPGGPVRPPTRSGPEGDR